MKLFGRELGRAAVPAEARSASLESESVSLNADNFFAFFGLTDVAMPRVTIDRALRVPPFGAGVNFLSRSLASVPLHAYKRTGDAAEKIDGPLETMVNAAPNDEWTSDGWRRYFWQGVFTGGRGLAWIERKGDEPVSIWPIDARRTQIQRVAGRKLYTCGANTYDAIDVIDVPFFLRDDQLRHHGPVTLGSKTLAIALAMLDYQGKFFAGGGVPPLALTGPMAQSGEGMKRAMEDIKRTIAVARETDSAMFPLPPGYELKPVAFEPGKSQAVEAWRLIIEDCSRLLSLPPVFIQDLTHGTFSNTEDKKRRTFH